MAHEFPLRQDPSELFGSSGLATLYSRIVPDGHLWVVRRIAWEGDLATSGGNTRARLYIERMGAKHYFSEQDAPAADTLYWDPDPIELWAGDRLALEWDQAQANTTLKMWFSGTVRVIDPGG